MRLGLAGEVHRLRDEIENIQQTARTFPVFVQIINNYYVDEMTGKKVDLRTLPPNTTVIINDIPREGGRT